MLDCIHICVFPYWKTVFKQSHFLTAGYLSSFSTSSYRNLDSFSTTRWIDKDFLWILNSFSTAGGSIELLFSLLLNCPSTDPWQLHLSTPFCSTPGSICRDLLGFYLSANRDFLLIFLDLSLNRLVFSPPKTLFLSPNLIPTCFSSFFKFFPSLGKFLFSHLHAFHVLKPRFWDFWNILGFFKIDEFLLKFWDGFLLKWV